MGRRKRTVESVKKRSKLRRLQKKLRAYENTVQSESAQSEKVASNSFNSNSSPESETINVHSASECGKDQQTKRGSSPPLQKKRRAYQNTKATEKIFSLNKRIRAVSGGTSASKTISILVWLIDRGQAGDNEVMTVVAESVPHLKLGAVRDFKKFTCSNL